MSHPPKSIESIRADFPLIQETEFIFLDSAASSQKPKPVIDRITNYYSFEHANVHRGIYQLSEKATASYESVRGKIKEFIGAPSEEQIVFTRGTTESINLVANGLGKVHLKQGDEVIVPISEHHSNIVPWQMLELSIGIKVVFCPLDERYRVDLEKLYNLINNNTKVIALAHVSNVLGIRHPIEEICKVAAERGILTVIDGAQGMPHEQPNLEALGCDFYALSAHKCLGPTGVGVLYGKKEWLDKLPPMMGGGDMIKEVHTTGYIENDVPHKFEAGTPIIAGVVGFGAALDYLKSLDRKKLRDHERELGLYAYKNLKEMPGFKTLVSPGDDWLGIVSFYHESIHAHDLAQIADSEKVCLRAGHHCAQPLMESLGISGTVRMSPYLYNTKEEIDAFLNAMDKALKLLS